MPNSKQQTQKSMTAREYIISKHPKLADEISMELMDIHDIETLMEGWLVFLNEIDFETCEPIDAFENIRNVYYKIKMKRS